MKEIISSPNAPVTGFTEASKPSPIAQAIRAGNLLFVSGQGPLNAQREVVPAEIGAQTRQTLENLRAILAAKGLAWENVVKTTVYLQRMSDFAAMNEVYAHTLGTARPARSTVEVAGLPRGALVEIDVVAALRP